MSAETNFYFAPLTPIFWQPSGGLWLPATLDASGNLNVNVQAGAAGGTASKDESAFTAGSSYGTPIMGYDPTSGELLVVGLSAGTRNLAAVATPVTSTACSTNAPATVGTSSAQAIAANSSRKKLVLQNVGTTVLYVLLGAGSASATNFTFALPSGGSSKDGTCPVYVDTMWQGAVQWISSAAGGIGVANECT
jgi:hypothetical protein